jgi:hypothetical protein
MQWYKIVSSSGFIGVSILEEVNQRNFLLTAKEAMLRFKNSVVDCKMGPILIYHLEATRATVILEGARFLSHGMKFRSILLNFHGS